MTKEGQPYLGMRRWEVEVAERWQAMNGEHEDRALD